LFFNLNHLVEVWLDGNDCVIKSFGGPYYPSLTTMNDNLKNCYKNCLNDDTCLANMIVTTTTTTTESSSVLDSLISFGKKYFG
jgi:hypothetical protein